MLKLGSVAAIAIALTFTLTACTGGASTLTLGEAKSKLSASKIPCEAATEQDLSEVIPHDQDTAVNGNVLFCSDEGAIFGLGIFDDPKDIDYYLNLVCTSATTKESMSQLKEYEMLWGKNWFVDATSNPDLLPKLKSALDGEISNFASKCEKN